MHRSCGGPAAACLPFVPASFQVPDAPVLTFLRAALPPQTSCIYQG
jgi:hypothetical protein